jgi:hypothetical protein
MRCNVSAYDKLISRMRKRFYCCLNCYMFDGLNLNVSMEKER